MAGSRKKSPRKKAPPDSKPNPVPNLTFTLLLTPHGGLFSGGIFSGHLNGAFNEIDTAAEMYLEPFLT